MDERTTGPSSGARSSGFIHWWQSKPLYLRILGGLILGVLAGCLLGSHAAALALPSRLILRLLGALAPPLILVAVVQALLKTHLHGAIAVRLASLLLLNTTVAILIGLLVANVLKPGKHASIPPKSVAVAHAASGQPLGALDLIEHFLDNVPDSLLKPLIDNNVIGVIIVAVAFGIALRRISDRPIANVMDLVDTAFDTIVIVLHWVIDLVPIGVFGIVAATVGVQGFGPFKALAWFIAAVLIGLLLQASYYLIRIRFGSWVRPMQLLRGCRDAMVMAFSTDSSTATMPVTFACLRDKVGLRESSASMGALVGSNFNNDGTALYEAMSALFISQFIGRDLSLSQQIIVVLTSIVASVGAAGIPEAGLVTMTLVFTAVGLPTEYIAILLTVDWFLDRSRTVINVMGDMNISCLLDGRTPETADTRPMTPLAA